MTYRIVAPLFLLLVATGCVPGANADSVQPGASPTGVQLAAAPTHVSYSRTEFQIPANPSDELIFEYR